jgi:hypothetical protein
MAVRLPLQVPGLPACTKARGLGLPWILEPDVRIYSLNTSRCAAPPLHGVHCHSEH